MGEHIDNGIADADNIDAGPCHLAGLIPAGNGSDYTCIPARGKASGRRRSTRKSPKFGGIICPQVEAAKVLFGSSLFSPHYRDISDPRP
jgi:hypothetical protein